MAWSPVLNTPAQWNVTDTELLNSSAYKLLENDGVDAAGTYASSMFTTSQFLTALSNRQQQFLDLTGSIITRRSQPTTPQVPRYALPSDWIATRRVTYQNIDGDTYALFRADTYMLDNGMQDWMYDFAAPTIFSESALPTQEIEIVKAANDVGTVTLTYTALAATLTGAGVHLAVPDEFAPYILYGALADLLNSDGDGKDLRRSIYCEQRFQQGVELAKLLMRGSG
jgi:hypothetical protein